MCRGRRSTNQQRVMHIFNRCYLSSPLSGKGISGNLIATLKRFFLLGGRVFSAVNRYFQQVIMNPWQHGSTCFWNDYL